jgi:hypothetical protein
MKNIEKENLSNERVNDILDKISKYGIASITSLEKEFLDAHAYGLEGEVYKKIVEKETESFFEDDYGYFQFEYLRTEEHGEEKHHIGVLYVPDLEFPNGFRIEGRLEGKIVYFIDGAVMIDFNYNEGSFNYDVFEFCSGLEYELDNFIDYIVEELENRNKKNNI